MSESAAYRAEAAEKAVWKAVWACIVDASTMNVVLSGPEYKAAMRDYRVAVENAERARILAAVEGLADTHCYNCDYAGSGADVDCGDNLRRAAVVIAIVKGETT